MTDHSLKGKHAVIAGGGKNLGALIGLQLVEAGAAGIAVHYNSDSSKEAAQSTVTTLKDKGADAFALQATCRSSPITSSCFDEAAKRLGNVDIAINPAGVVIKKPILQVTEADCERSFLANLKAAFFFIQQAGRTLSDRGSIVSSLLAAYADSYAIYPGSKAPVEHFTRAASKEFGARGISIDAIGPGPMDTPFFYGQETKECPAYSKSGGRALQIFQDRTDRYRGYRAAGALPRQRGLADLRADYIRQRGLHRPLNA